jgi:dipeptidyl aminopeptidase/acylaminoacyl peptidase
MLAFRFATAGRVLRPMCVMLWLFTWGCSGSDSKPAPAGQGDDSSLELDVDLEDDTPVGQEAANGDAARNRSRPAADAEVVAAGIPDKTAPAPTEPASGKRTSQGDFDQTGSNSPSKGDANAPAEGEPRSPGNPDGRSPGQTETGPAAALPEPNAPALAAGDGDEPAGPAEPDYLAGVPLIPRRVLFGNPDRAAVEVSPDGTQLSFLAPLNGVLNVWVAPLDDPQAARPVTKDAERGIRFYRWAYTNEHIIYLQDQKGDENWHVYAVHLPSGELRDLTPLENVNARIENVTHRIPGELLVAVNDRDPQLHDLYRVNLATGERTLVEKNEQGFANYLVDDDLRVRFAMRFSPDGGMEVLAKREEGWAPFEQIPAEDSLTTSPAGFDKTGNVLYLIDSRGRNTGALFTVDLTTGEKKLLAEDERADLGEVLLHPTEYTVQAVSFTYDRKQWRVLDPGIEADLLALRAVADGELEIISRSLDDRVWIAAFLMDNGPVRYYRYDRPQRRATFLFTNRSALESQPLVKMYPVIIPARDGLPLVSYLTLPPGTDSDGDGRPHQPLPMVLNVHGGPWSRDSWGYDPEHQLLANRGYAVLSVNFRGSTGLGKNHLNAGNREWGGKMHDDLIDAVHWAIERRIARPDKVAIMGGSYGGYATLAGLTLTPEVFACGVDIVGPSNILTLIASVPPYWAPVLQMFKDRIGDFGTEEGRKLLTERSPLTHVDKICRPLLIGQGKNDPRVKQAESDQIVKAMQERGIAVTYVLYPDEGHGFARPENRLSFYAVTEAFLARHLGGRYEPIGDAFEGSSIQVLTGAEQVPGLAPGRE